MNIQTDSTACSLERLPPKVADAVLSQLNLQDLIATSHACYAWRAIFEEFVEKLDLPISAEDWTDESKSCPPVPIQSLQEISLKTFLNALPNMTPLNFAFDAPVALATFFSHNTSSSRDEALRELALKMHQVKGVRTLKLQGAKIDDDTLLALSGKLPDLEVIDLTGCKFSANIVVQFLNKQPQTTKLILSRTDYSAQELGSILSRRNSLAHLELDACNNMTDQTLHVVGQHCTQLHTLNLNWCEGITNEGVDFIAKHCSQLVQLGITGAYEVTDKSLQSIARHLPQLTHLNARIFQDPASEPILNLANHCHQLVALELSIRLGCVNDESPEVQSRGSSSIADTCMDALINGCTRLTNLTLWDCQGLTDKGLKSIARLQTQLTQLGIRNLDQGPRITDEGLTYLAQRCPRITHLTLKSCEKITDDGLMAVARYSPMLTHLELGYCGITGRSFEMIGQWCPHLIAMDINYCQQLTDNALQALAKHAHSLRAFRIVGCEKVTQQGIQALFDSCLELERWVVKHPKLQLRKPK